jgi:hypothetical protein
MFRSNQFELSTWKNWSRVRMDLAFLKSNSFGTNQFELGLEKTGTWSGLTSELKLQMSTQKGGAAPWPPLPSTQSLLFHSLTNVLFFYRWDKCFILSIGGANVMVALISGGFCVGGTNVSGTVDGGAKVAPPSILPFCLIFIKSFSKKWPVIIQFYKSFILPPPPPSCIYAYNEIQLNKEKT